MHRTFIRWLVGCVGILLYFQPIIVAACSVAMPMPNAPTAVPISFEQVVQQIPVIVEGEVTALSDNRLVTTFKVSRYIKGSGADTIKIMGFGQGTDCLPTTSLGERGVLYLIPEANGYALQGRGFQTLTDTDFQTISRIVGSPPMVATHANTSFVWIVVAVGVIVLVGGLWWLQRHKSLRSKEKF